MSSGGQVGELRGIRALDEPALSALLGKNRDRDVYMRSLVWNLGAGVPPEVGMLLGWWVDEDLVGAFLHGPVVVMCCEDPAGLAAFAKRVGYYWYEQPVAQLMAPRSMSEIFLAALADHFGVLPPLHLLRHRMPAMRLGRGTLPSSENLGLDPAMVNPPLHRGVFREEALLGDLARAVTIEDLGLDPLVFAPASFREALRHRIALGREFLWIEAGRPVFRAAISAATPETVLVEGVYVPKGLRGRGYGKAGMHALCALLLERHESVVLLVGEDNDAARRLYELLGFAVFDEYQAAFFDVELPPEASPPDGGTPP